MNQALILYKLSNKQINVTVPDVPDELSITKAYFMLKTNWTDEDEDAVVNMSITTSPTSAGVIDDNGADDNTGVLKFVIGTAALDEVTDLKHTYYSAIKVILSNGSAYLLPNSLMPTKVHIAAINATS